MAGLATGAFGVELSATLCSMSTRSRRCMVMTCSLLAAITIAPQMGCVMTKYRLRDGSIVNRRRVMLTAFKLFARGDLSCSEVSVRWESRLLRGSRPGSYYAEGCDKASWFDCREEVTEVPDDYQSLRLICERR